jgi:hypothetical protein
LPDATQPFQHHGAAEPFPLVGRHSCHGFEISGTGYIIEPDRAE